MENWSAKPIPAASPVRHRGRDDGYDAVHVRMMPSLSVCSSAHGASPEADEIAPMLNGKSIANAPTAQTWRKGPAFSTRGL
jgi:hypothetical protein